MASVIMCLPMQHIDVEKLRRFLTTHEDFKDWHEILEGEVSSVLRDDIDQEQRMQCLGRSSSLEVLTRAQSYGHSNIKL
ncbi:hypothetical protein NOR_04627 [Metarhizium rileyi]|uniref:Uncharacterized protein n=1 Tax=Metarhizium rileyi (strain RCEF 4871) TaxID=1649241 RepID=A0A162LR90_METRR|nr:hypothetical protein NOR_04627 [Metarhizium rileyi RCEF 4871]